MRKNIFEILSEDFNVSRELNKIYQYLFNISSIEGIKYSKKLSIADFVNNVIFPFWKNRHGCCDCQEMAKRLNIHSISQYADPSITEIIIFMEFSLNILSLCEQALERNDGIFIGNANFVMLANDTNELLEHYNLTTYEIDEDEQIIIVEKNSAVTAVAEIVDKKLAREIIQYNHHLLKGDISRKKAILLSLSFVLEPERNALKALNSNLEDNLFFLYNSLSIRHNNADPKEKKYFIEYVSMMKEDEFESWYDEIYQMTLLAFLLIDNINRSKSVKDLKKKIKGE